jgi:hypothetical protein
MKSLDESKHWLKMAIDTCYDGLEQHARKCEISQYAALLQ